MEHHGVILLFGDLLNEADLIMAAPRRGSELGLTEKEVAEMARLARSRTEPASRVARARMLLAYRETPSPEHGSWLNLVGPGLGAHCIPIDPFYLTWKAHEYGIVTRFTEFASEINTRMPHRVSSRIAEVFDRKACVSLSRASVLILGICYKKNIDEMRESPALMLLELLEARGAYVEFCGPHIPVIPEKREHGHLGRRRAVDCSRVTIAKFDDALLATDHDAFDYNDLVTHAKLIVGIRNACGVRGPTDEKIVKA